MFNKIYVDGQKLLHNLNIIKKESNSKVCAMVKANAYGVGLKEVVLTLTNKVEFFGVATQSEADKVRELTKSKILIVGSLSKQQIKDYSYTCTCVEDIDFLIAQNKKINIHLKINTGMNRFGVKPCQVKAILNKIKGSKLNLEGLFTHFATADEFVEVQYKRFKKVVDFVHSMGFKPIIHSDNSANYNKHKLDMVRVGFCLYNENLPFEPVCSISAEILQVNKVKSGDLVGYDYNFVANKNMKIAVVSMGYADGFLRGYIGMELNYLNKPCRVLNVCMDCFMLDVTNVKTKKGERIFILNNKNNLLNYANFIKTSPYEISTNFGNARAERILI